MNAIERTLHTKNLLWYNFFFWLGICVFEIFKTFSFSNGFNYDFEVKYLIRWPISVYLTFWLLSFAVFQSYMASKNLFKKPFILLHIVFSILFGVIFKYLAPVVGLLLERLLFETETLPFNELWKIGKDTIFNIVFGIGVYWGILIALLVINYYRRYQDQYAKGIDLEKQLGNSQLRSMKMQLQPHFLFNAFNTIVMMVRQKRNKEAVSMISNLSDMLRQSLNKENNQFVKLGEEIDLLKKYLSIESQRYKERLNIEWDLDDELNNYLVPSLVLQPIVENAFKHGISKNIKTSILRISTKKLGKKVELKVFNSGSTLPSHWSFHKDKGIGMANTTSRLLKLYNEEFRFLINEQEGGVSVALQLPIKYGSEN